MVKIRFETGQVINFDGTPTQADIEEVAQSLKANQPKGRGATGSWSENKPFLPGIDTTENKISGRSDLLKQFFNDLSKPAPESIVDKAKFLIPGYGMIDTAKTALKGIGGVLQKAESAIANPLMDIQAGNINSVGNDIIKGITGERKGELGDLVRRTGFGGSANEALSSTAGMFASMGAMNLITKGKLIEGGRKILKSMTSNNAPAKASKDLFFKQRADMLAQGADDVVNSVRSEFDDLYSKIGNNPIGPDDQAVVKEALDILTPSKVKRFSRMAGVNADDLAGSVDDLNKVKSLKGVIGRAVPKKVWSGIEDATPDQTELINIYHELNDILAKNAGESRPILQALNAKYKDVLNYRKVIYRLTKNQTTGVTSTSIRSIRSEANQGNLAEIQNFGDKFMPKVYDILKDIDKYNKKKMFMDQFNKFGLRVAEGAAIGGTLGALMYRE